MNIEKIKDFAFKLNYDIEIDDFLFQTGISKKTNIISIYDKHKKILDRNLILSLIREINSVNEEKEKLKLKLLTKFLAEKYLKFKVQDVEAKIYSAISKFEVNYKGKKLKIRDIVSLLSVEKDIEKRKDLINLRIEFCKKYNPLFEKKHELMSKLITNLGFRNQIDLYCFFNNIDIILTKKLIKSFLTKTNRTYKNLLKENFNEYNLPMDYGGFIYWLSGIKFGGQLDLVSINNQTFNNLGLDLSEIKKDLKSRPNKANRPFCWMPNPPKEVMLSVNLTGGFEDVRGLLHETGHAVHQINVNKNSDVIYRCFNSHTNCEIFATLFEDLTLNEDWLKLYIPDEQEKILRYANLKKMFLLRRYCAKSLFELKLYKKGITAKKKYGRYLKKYTLAEYPPELYLMDTDDFFYSLNYVFAWTSSNQVSNFLKKKFGNLWFQNKECAKFLKELWSEKDYDFCGLLKKLNYEKPDCTYLIKEFEQLTNR